MDDERSVEAARELIAAFTEDAAFLAYPLTTGLMTEHSRGRSFRPEQPGAVLNGRISRRVFDAWWPAGVAMPAD